MATWLFDAGGLPQECVEIETDNPLTAGLLLAATPYSVFSTPPTRGFLGPVQGVRGGVLAGPPVRHGVANSTIVLLDLCVGQDGGNWWSAGDIAYRDTSAAWPNDVGLVTISTTSYGRMTVGARDSGGTVRWAEVDVVSGGLARGDVLFRAATIDSALLVRAFGNDGGYVGQSTAMQGFTYAAPTGSSGPVFGNTGANDTVTYQALALRFGRVVADAEIAALAKDLGQVFRRRRPVWAMAGAGGGTDYPVTRTESADASDTASLTIIYAATAAEIAEATSAHAAAMAAAVSIAETGEATSTQAGALTAFVSIAETGAATDSASTAGLYGVTVAEASDAADVESAIRALFGTTSETGAATDTTNGTASGDYTATITEAATASSLEAAVSNYLAAISESASASDTASASLPGEYSVSISEAASAIETAVCAMSALVTINEAAAAADVANWVGAITFTRAPRGGGYPGTRPTTTRGGQTNTTRPTMANTRR